MKSVHTPTPPPPPFFATRAPCLFECSSYNKSFREFGIMIYFATLISQFDCTLQHFAIWRDFRKNEHFVLTILSFWSRFPVSIQVACLQFDDYETKWK